MARERGLCRTVANQKRERDEDEKFIPLCRMKIETNEDGRIHEHKDICIHGIVQPRFPHRVWLESDILPKTIFDDNNMNMTVGRSSYCDLRIDKTETDVSLLHCCIMLKQHGLYIVDMNSLNGTRINGVKIPCGQHTLLRHEDRIQLSYFDVIFQVNYFQNEHSLETLDDDHTTYCTEERSSV